MSRNRNIDDVKQYLFTNIDDLPPMTEQKKQYMERISVIYLLRLNNPDMPKREIYNAVLKLKHNISDAQFYKDIDVAEQLIGDVYSVRRDYQQWLAIQEIDRAKELTLRADDLTEIKRAQNMLKIAEIRAKVANVHLPESDAPPIEDFKPSEIEISADITLTGIEKTSDDLNKFKQEMRQKYAYKPAQIRNHNTTNDNDDNQP